MLDILSQVGLDTNQFLTIFAIAAVLIILAYRPFVISILDPLNVFIIAMIADAILMFGLDWDASMKVEFTFFIIFFWIGFALAGKVSANNPVIRFDDNALQELEIVLLFASVTIVIANVYLGFTEGFPIFSAEPSEAKVTAYTGGLGLIRHVNQGPYLFLCCGSTLMIAMGRKRKLALSMLVITSAFVALSGAKGALLPVLFVQAFVMNHKGLAQSVKYSKKFKKFAIPSVGAAVAVAITVVTRENGGFTGGILFLAKRILFFGDVILFYYSRRGAIPELVGVGPFDYVHYLVDPILGMFRIVDYASIRPPLGTIISDSDLGFGPNAQYFVRADIFFGPILGCIYCLALGYLIGAFRNRFFTFRPRNAMTFVFSLLLAVSALNAAIESSLFFSVCADTIFFFVPLWCFARVATMASSISHQTA